MQTETTPAGTQRNDPIGLFLTEATMPPRQLKKDEIPALREAAIDELERRYGAFSPEMARLVEDPIHKFMIMAEMANWAWGFTRTMDTLRHQRRNAVGVLRYHYGWTPMRVIRHLGADPKKRRLVDFTLDKADQEALPDWSEEYALKVSKEAHKACEDRTVHGREIRPERDEMIRSLAVGRAGDSWGDDGGPRKWGGAEIARLAGISSAAITQICNGTAPSAKRAARAA